MTVYNWLSLFGIPAIILAMLTFAFKKLSSGIKQNHAEDDAIKHGLQAILRDNLYRLYRYGCQQGYTELYERENFANLYKQYHGLGANGVMDDIKSRYFDLPDKAEYYRERK